MLQSLNPSLWVIKGPIRKHYRWFQQEYIYIYSTGNTCKTVPCVHFQLYVCQIFLFLFFLPCLHASTSSVFFAWSSESYMFSISLWGGFACLLEHRRAVCAGAGLSLVWPLGVKLSAFGGDAVVVAGMFICCCWPHQWLMLMMLDLVSASCVWCSPHVPLQCLMPVLEWGRVSSFDRSSRWTFGMADPAMNCSRILSCVTFSDAYLHFSACVFMRM